VGEHGRALGRQGSAAQNLVARSVPVREAGGDIEDNTRRVLERYHAFNWERLALTADQVRV
jgi:hypothetical protein